MFVVYIYHLNQYWCHFLIWLILMSVFQVCGTCTFSDVPCLSNRNPKFREYLCILWIHFLILPATDIHHEWDHLGSSDLSALHRKAGCVTLLSKRFMKVLSNMKKSWDCAEKKNNLTLYYWMSYSSFIFSTCPFFHSLLSIFLDQKTGLHHLACFHVAWRAGIKSDRFMFIFLISNNYYYCELKIFHCL